MNTSSSYSVRTACSEHARHAQLNSCAVRLVQGFSCPCMYVPCVDAGALINPLLACGRRESVRDYMLWYFSRYEAVSDGTGSQIWHDQSAAGLWPLASAAGPHCGLPVGRPTRGQRPTRAPLPPGLQLRPFTPASGTSPGRHQRSGRPPDGLPCLKWPATETIVTISGNTERGSLRTFCGVRRWSEGVFAALLTRGMPDTMRVRTWEHGGVRLLPAGAGGGRGA